MDGISVLTSLACTITNNSDFDLMLTKVTCYQDDVVAGYINYNSSSGAFGIGTSKTAKFDITVEYEEVEKEEENTDDTTTDDTTTGDTTTDDSSSSGTRADGDVEKKPIVNTHTYTFVWEYTYKNENFTYKCEDPEKKQAKSSARKARRR